MAQECIGLVTRKYPTYFISQKKKQMPNTIAYDWKDNDKYIIDNQNGCGWLTKRIFMMISFTCAFWNFMRKENLLLPFIALALPNGYWKCLMVLLQNFNAIAFSIRIYSQFLPVCTNYLCGSTKNTIIHQWLLPRMESVITME